MQDASEDKKRKSSEAILNHTDAQSPMIDGIEKNGGQVHSLEERTSWAPASVQEAKVLTDKPIFDKTTPSSLRGTHVKFIQNSVPRRLRS